LTDRLLLRLPVEDVVANLSRFLTGWAGYFRRGNSTTTFHKLDLYTTERLARWIGSATSDGHPLAMAAGACAKSVSSACNRSSDVSITVSRTPPDEGCRCAV
jgi:Group II intron, maturase-specific domain